MDNRDRNDLFGLFRFPIFGSPQPTFTLNVEENESELTIEGNIGQFEKENLRVEVVRNGVYVHVEQTVQEEEEGGEEEKEEERVTFPPMQRFIPIYFPFTEKDVAATFNDEEKVLKIILKKNDENRKFINIE